MQINSTEKTNASSRSVTLALKIVKSDMKSNGIAATGLMYNKV